MLAFKKIIDLIPTYLIYILALVLPLIFTTLTTEYFETAKLILLSSVVLLMLLFWAARGFTEGKITLLKTPLDFLFILFLLVAILSTVLSQTPYPAFFGLLPKVHGSLIFIITIVLLYFMVSSNIKDKKSIQNITVLLIISGVILALVSLLSFFKIYLPFEFANLQNFSLTGSLISLTTFLVVILPLSLSKALSFRNFSDFSITSLLGTVSSLLFIITIILVGNLSVLVATLICILLSLYFQRAKRDQILVVSIICLIGIAISILIYTPTLQNKTILGTLSSSLNREVQLPFSFSWKISAGAFRDSPILGTGPGTYLYNFTQYKPIEINRTDLWDKRVSSAHNQYSQTWAELGGAGVILLLVIALSFIIIAYRNHDLDGLALSGIIFFITMALSPMSVLTQAIGFLLVALFLGSLRDHSQIKEIDLNLRTSYGAHPLIPTLIFIPVLCISFAGFYFIGKLGIGEYYHRLALNYSLDKNGRDAYNSLVVAERRNPQIDLYRVDLAQTNFALANAIATAKGPSEASPGGSLTEDDKKNIQQLLQQSIAEGRASVALASRSSANWEILGSIYRQISGVAQNSVSFSLDSYGKAIQRDPFNPILRVVVGQIYYQVKNYDLAVRFFDDAVSLKPDFPNALYNLSIALREKGSLQEAARITERLVSSLQDRPDSNDYKLASKLLLELNESLKNRTATESAKLQTEPGSALEKNNLPNVIDLPKPDKISTPPAIQR